MEVAGARSLLVLCRGCGGKVLLSADGSCPACGARGEVVPPTEAGRSPAILVPAIQDRTRGWRYGCLYLRPFADRRRGSARIRAVGRAMQPFGRTVTLHAGEARLRLRDVQPVTRTARWLDTRRQRVGAILTVFVLGAIAVGWASRLTPREAGSIVGYVTGWALVAVLCILAWRILLVAIETVLAVSFRVNGVDFVEGNPPGAGKSADDRWRASFRTLAATSRFIVMDASRWGTGLAYEISFLRELQLETRLILLCRDSPEAIAEFQNHARELGFGGIQVALVRYKWWRLGAMTRQLRREAGRLAQSL